ncbi:uncharacterized protein [Engystomops pustulosus]|uniref:uncharacterized protein n=1 Tax=Engystomops pustulosus TaxID=76066 RepID=UPI003AFA1B28
MDLQAREAAWTHQVPSIFSNTGEVKQDDDFKTVSNDLLEAHRALTRVWWNIRSLEEYHKLKMSPRGLRIHIFPSWEVVDDEKERWEKGLHQCSFILINMLLDHDRGLLSRIREQIKKAEVDLEKFDRDTQVIPFQAKLKETIDAYEKEIIKGKKEKFARDKRDYENGRIFKWNHKGNRRRTFQRPRPTTSYTQSASSELPSSDTSEQDTSQDEGTSSKNKKRAPRHRDWSPTYKRDRPARGKKANV